jgi:serine/threonine protein kinase
MASFNHPNIVTFFGFAWDGRTMATLCAVTEYCDQGDLKSFLMSHSKTELSWDKAKAVLALDIARALQYLHETQHPPVIHRDLKSKNILVAMPHAKLSDFGISRDINADTHTLTAGVGTAYYSAPEVMGGESYSTSADIFSFGCVLVELDTHMNLYEDLKIPPVSIVQKVIHENLRPSLSVECPSTIRDIVMQCFQRSPHARPTASELVLALSAFLFEGSASNTSRHHVDEDDIYSCCNI